MSSLLLRIALLIHLSWAWTTFLRPKSCGATQLQSGIGIAKDYSWREEAFEIEVTVMVPPDTKAKDIRFKAKANSIGLFMKRTMAEGDTEEIVLLDPDRALRGRIDVDGTFWVISDAIEDEAKNSAPVDDDEEGATKEQLQPGRKVTITIEKVIKTAKDDFEVIDYDWNGVYREEKEGEVSYRKYDEPEELDVREYAQSLGVDIDNINMSMVDKSMFSSGLNVTKTGMDSMMNAGLMKEVTQQGDGSEWTTDEDGYRVPFNSMLTDKGGDQSNLQNLYGAKIDEETNEGEKGGSVPFLDTDSPWHKAADAASGAAVANDPPPKDEKKRKAWEEKKKQLKEKQKKEAIDPISTLTVAKLREILRARGLKVSGSKKELQDRLRAEVQSMVEMDTSE